MSDNYKPVLGDRVRVTIEGTFRGLNRRDEWSVVTDEGLDALVRPYTWSSVEKLESRLLPGTVIKSGTGKTIWIVLPGDMLRVVNTTNGNTFEMKNLGLDR